MDKVDRIFAQPEFPNDDVRGQPPCERIVEIDRAASFEFVDQGMDHLPEIGLLAFHFRWGEGAFHQLAHAAMIGAVTSDQDVFQVSPPVGEKNGSFGIEIAVKPVRL